MNNQPCDVPLVERLRSVPIKCHEMIEVGPCHHRNIPYGAMCHEAADEIDDVTDKWAELFGQLAQANAALEAEKHQSSVNAQAADNWRTACARAEAERDAAAMLYRSFLDKPRCDQPDAP